MMGSWPRRIFAGCLVALCMGTLLVAGTGWCVVFHNKGMPKHLNANALAEAEAAMWQLYYSDAQKGPRLGMMLLGVLREQFGISYRTGYTVASELAIGTVAFKQTQGDYDRKVLPHLVAAYTALRGAVEATWDPKEVAQAELAWWVARRTPGQDSPESVGRLIAKEYSLLCDKDNEDVQRAGLLRAQAAALRDRTAPNSDWPAIGVLLHDSYAALARGIE